MLPSGDHVRGWGDEDDKTHKKTPAITGAELIANERARQIASEGWDAFHDDQHDCDELARAAATYAIPAHMRRLKEIVLHRSRRTASVPRSWPWEAEWWKPEPKDRIRELVKAGALIAAEIDRLTRAADSARTEGGKW